MQNLWYIDLSLVSGQFISSQAIILYPKLFQSLHYFGQFKPEGIFQDAQLNFLHLLFPEVHLGSAFMISYSLVSSIYYVQQWILVSDMVNMCLVVGFICYLHIICVSLVQHPSSCIMRSLNKFKLLFNPFRKVVIVGSLYQQVMNTFSMLKLDIYSCNKLRLADLKVENSKSIGPIGQSFFYWTILF